MRFIFEVVLEPDESGGYCVYVPDLDGCFTEGDTVVEALGMADDALKTFVAVMMKYGDEIPEPTFGHEAPKGGMVIAMTFETDAGYIIEEVAPSKAAEMLGVSRSRVSNMIKSGLLESTKVCGETRASLESINAYLASPRKAGRPPKGVAKTAR